MLKSALLQISFSILPMIVAYSNTSFSGDAGSVAKPGCRSKCGNLIIPYPFGIRSNKSCSINPSFDIICNESSSPPKAFLASASSGVLVTVLGISETKIRIMNQPAHSCFDNDGNLIAGNDFGINFTGTPFSFSNENKLTAVGCDAVAFALTNPYNIRYNSNDFITSCVAICSKIEDLSNGVCSGIGCCQASIPKGVQSIYSAMTTLTDQRKAPELSGCGYAFLAEQISYDFNISDISDPSFLNTTTETVPVVLDWAIGSKTCNQIKNTGEAICQQNGACVDSGTTLGGYRCNCSQGYQGNPYLSPGRILSSSNMRTTSSLLLLIFLYLAAEGANISKPGCPSKCGNLEVPYPFGIGVNSNCSINPFFSINCNASFDPPKAFLSVDNIEVLGISEAQISVTNRPAKGCYDDLGNQVQSLPFIMNMSSTSFSFSSENMLTVVGCDDAAFLSRDVGLDDYWPDLSSSCVAICSKPGQLSNGFCSGIGCCQSSIPEGLQSIYVFMDSVMGHDNIHNFSTCGYSFLAGKSSYNFNVSLDQKSANASTSPSLSDSIFSR